MIEPVTLEEIKSNYQECLRGQNIQEHIDYVRNLLNKIEKNPNFWDASELAAVTAHLVDAVANDQTRSLFKAMKFGLDYAWEWCLPGYRGCGKSRYQHENGRLCYEREETHEKGDCY